MDGAAVQEKAVVPLEAVCGENKENVDTYECIGTILLLDTPGTEEPSQTDTTVHHKWILSELINSSMLQQEAPSLEVLLI